MRKTKVICTIGPSCEDEKTLTQMCMEGMNVERLKANHPEGRSKLKIEK